MVPITISGLGMREGLFVGFYMLFGVASETAVAVSLLNYLIVIVLQALIGAFFYLMETIRHRDI